MEKISVGLNPKQYEIQTINQIRKNVLMISFIDAVPESWDESITVYTAGGIKATTLEGWNTVYRNEGKIIYLSNDGSVYVDPETPGELPGEPYVPTPEELLAAAQASKRAEVSAACEQIIYNGVSVELSDGSVEHFSMTEHDQINLFGKQVQLAAGAEQLEYHADGQPCRYYSAADMQAIITAAMFHVSYHTTYCNAMNMWISGCETAEEVAEVYYGADVPEEYQSEVLQAYLTQIADMTGGDEHETDEG